MCHIQIRSAAYRAATMSSSGSLAFMRALTTLLVRDKLILWYIRNVPIKPKLESWQAE